MKDVILECNIFLSCARIVGTGKTIIYCTEFGLCLGIDASYATQL
jgi:hypothetical protein